eukprot:m.28488 g.28488  ORF g.28488 m.28488 type:complete len:450 (-) comp14153_c0_seq1:172-1521(-)
MRFWVVVFLGVCLACEPNIPTNLLNDLSLELKASQTKYQEWNCASPLPDANIRAIAESILVCDNTHGCDGDLADGRARDFWESYREDYDVDLPRADLLARYRTLLDFFTTSKLQSEAYGNNLMFNLTWESVWLSATPPEPGDTFHPGDLAAWHEFYDINTIHLPKQCDREWPCTCNVLCHRSASTNETRIKAFDMLFTLDFNSLDLSEFDPEHGLDPETDVFDPPIIPASFGDLTELELFAGVVTGVPEQLGLLPNLRILLLDYDDRFQLPESFGSSSSLELVEVRSFTGGTFQAIEPLCKVKSIKGLFANGLSGRLPECIGDMQELVRLVLLSEQFDEPTELPESFSQLSNLRVFYSFYSGEIACPPADAKPGDCKPKFVAVNDFSLENPPWQCRQHGFVGTIPASYKNLTKMEKWWIDANFFEGTLPEWIGTDWSNLVGVNGVTTME